MSYPAAPDCPFCGALRRAGLVHVEQCGEAVRVALTVLEAAFLRARRVPLVDAAAWTRRAAGWSPGRIDYFYPRWLHLVSCAVGLDRRGGSDFTDWPEGALFRDIVTGLAVDPAAQRELVCTYLLGGAAAVRGALCVGTVTP